jgi:hypothetical protein
MTLAAGAFNNSDSVVPSLDPLLVRLGSGRQSPKGWGQVPVQQVLVAGSAPP